MIILKVSKPAHRFASRAPYFNQSQHIDFRDAKWCQFNDTFQKGDLSTFPRTSKDEIQELMSKTQQQLEPLIAALTPEADGAAQAPLGIFAR